MKCLYCDQYYKSQPLPRSSGKFDGARTCKFVDKMIKANDQACKFYCPTSTFVCDNNNIRLDLLQCLSRRLNRLNLEGFQICQGCSQFDKEIASIINEYYVKCKKVIKPREIKPIEVKPKKRKRRIIQKPTKKLHRRVK